jgi:molybdate transport system substrate-binding protein
LTTAQLLRSAGLRRTAARVAVLDLLDRVDRPLSHQEIAASPEAQRLDRVTLYRTLSALQEADLVHRVQGIDGAWRFCTHCRDEGCGGDHVHFLCVDCNRMSCLPDQPLPWVEEPEGAEVLGKQLVVHGRCARCRSQGAPVAVLLLCLLWLAGAAGAGCTSHESSTRSTLRVFAASSLTEAFQDLERGFEASHPAVDIEPIFAGSQVLRLQIEQGAAADVFASANVGHMSALIAEGSVPHSRTFVHNELVVIVPSDNPASVGTFAELSRATRLVVGTEHVPVGIYTRQIFEKAGRNLGSDFVDQIRANVVSEESNVRLVRAKVEMGEADAAIVYRTDVTASDRVHVVPIPDDLNVLASYLIGTLDRSSEQELAGQFVAYVLSAEGRRILAEHGFKTELR